MIQCSPSAVGPRCAQPALGPYYDLNQILLYYTANDFNQYYHDKMLTICCSTTVRAASTGSMFFLFSSVHSTCTHSKANNRTIFQRMQPARCPSSCNCSCSLHLLPHQMAHWHSLQNSHIDACSQHCLPVPAIQLSTPPARTSDGHRPTLQL